jgi:hypothetical protein
MRTVDRRERDFTIASQVARISNTDDVRPKHVRLAGVAYLLGASMCFVFTLGHISFERRFFPTLLLLIPVLAVLGAWHLLDAKALAEGRRRHQKLILWGGSVAALALGIVLAEGFKRGWF